MTDENNAVRRPTVAMDFDGPIYPLAAYTEPDDFSFGPVEGARDRLTELCEVADVFIYTSRTSESVAGSAERGAFIGSKIWAWLGVHWFPPGITVYAGFGKPPADVYLDDRAWRIARPGDWNGAIAHVRRLAGLDTSQPKRHDPFTSDEILERLKAISRTTSGRIHMAASPLEIETLAAQIEYRGVADVAVTSEIESIREELSHMRDTDAIQDRQAMIENVRALQSMFDDVGHLLDEAGIPRSLDGENLTLCERVETLINLRKDS